MKELFTKIIYEAQEGRSTVLVTIIREDGSAPRGTGAQMLVGSTGRLLGTVGGGPSEKLAEEYALRLLPEQRSDTRDFGLRPGSRGDTGAVCGGEVTMYFQYVSASEPGWKTLSSALVSCISEHRRAWLVQHLDGSLATLVDEEGAVIAGAPVPVEKDMLGSGSTLSGLGYFATALPIGERAILFGAGHCSYALCPVLQSVGFRVTVFDDRPEYAAPERFPGAEQVICGDFSRIGEKLQLQPDDYVVVMTSGHAHDFEVQEQVLRSETAYVGVIGSKRKVAYVQGRLRESGIAEERILAVHSPIGINIKSVTPEEIAISITAEMIRERATIREQLGEETHSCPMH